MESGIEEQKLKDTIKRGRKVIADVSRAFKEPWAANPSTGVRAIFGLWINKAVKHLAAITILAEEGDLALIADVHYRQLLEIYFQVRRLAMMQGKEREMLAQKVSAWGCIDYLRKMEKFKDQDFAKAGYKQVKEQSTQYDPELIKEIEQEHSQRIWYWFGRSVSSLAKQVSGEGEDLDALYHMVSAQLHGSWDATLDITNPQPGVLNFCPYPNKDTLYRWAADSVDRATQLYIKIWNEIAAAIGAPTINVKL